VVVGTPVRSDSSPTDNNAGVPDDARAGSVAVIDFKFT
jgi:hypothetical protein